MNNKGKREKNKMEKEKEKEKDLTTTESAFEIAKDLNSLGHIDDIKMRSMELLLKLPEIKEYSANDIKKIRGQYKMSQEMLAEFLNCSKSTIESWEQKKKKPSSVSNKLLSILEKKGLEVFI